MTDSRPVAYEFAGFRLDPKRRSLTRADGTAVALTGKVFDALLHLVEHAGEVVGRDALTKALWPKTIVEENNLNVTISALRRALGDEGSGHRHVVTVAGRGYQFVTDVRVVHAPSSDMPAAATAPVAAPSAPTHPRRGIGIAASVLGVAVLGLVYATLPDATPPAGVGSVARVVRLTTYAGTESSVALSPDATHVAFSWDGGAQNPDIYVLRLGAQTPLKLTNDPSPEYGAAWSPDGSQIAFLRQHDSWRADIVVVPALGGAERKLQSVRVWPMNLPWVATSLAWSPDGKHLLYTTQKENGGDLASGFGFHLLSLETGLVRPLALAGDGYDASPAFSSDGKRLVFARYDLTARDAQLMVQDLGPDFALRGDPQPVPGTWLGAPRFAAWYPDNNRLAFVRGSQILEWTIGGALRPVYATAGEVSGFSLGWRDGEPVAVAAFYDDNFDIWSLPLDPTTRQAIGVPARLIHSTAREWQPRYSPDGRRLAFTSWRSGAPDIWLADADGSNARQVSHLGASDPGHPRWSPDGEQLSFMAFTPNDEPHTYLVDVDEGLPRLVTNGAATGWSRDGQHLYMTELGGTSRVIRFRLADGYREPLVANAVAAQETFDGRRILYSKTNQLGIFARGADGDVASNAEERLVDDYAHPQSGSLLPVEGGFYYVGYTPDGLARALRFYDDATRTATDIAPVPSGARVIFGLTVSPDGSELLFGAPLVGADIVSLEF